ncbi:zinc finger BED domain-containing protein 4-like [Rhipicephalus sanguineus]|uniref:zinc finger BED domain-containing protein 4-like n=1 Tax=Rhipicephalus sanguineus TaxID=34632 RepID=UPI0020C3A725|nr:zinc finger BED domain-containing protein 4-like [Rhipicephalus sanguineus]
MGGHRGPVTATCVTAHMMDRDFTQHAYALACKPMLQEHTGENIVQFLRDVIKERGLPDNIPTFVITDNGRNFVSAVAKCNWSGLLCFAHTLQLCINDAKREVACFSQLCAKCRSIVDRYKRSACARARLMDIQKDMHMAQHEVIHDVLTRWNSEYAMMERLAGLRAPISVELCDSDVDNLSSREWKLMAATVKVLQPLDQATTELCADRYLSLSQVIPLMHCTQVVPHEHVSEGEEAASFARSLLRSFSTRFPGFKMANVPANVMLVDPCYKDICYTEDSQKKWAKATLAAAANELMPAQNDCARAHVCPAIEKPPANTLWSVFFFINL